MAHLERPVALGKFLFNSGEKLWVKGVSYGTFEPDEHGNEFHDRARVERDLALISAHGLNAVRTYTAPPRWLLDVAWKYRLRVMIGLPWEQHVAFLDDKRRSCEVRKRVRDAVSLLAGHPAVLCCTIGNEIPAPIVRWHGARRIEQFLQALYADAKEEDPEALFTYVNYPSTEYLELDFVDFVSFNIYLETQQSLAAYIARLQNIAGDRPLLLTELGLDSLRNGEQTQACVLDWQVRTAFAEGCAGVFVFSWTDEWHRGGQDITDWAFGLTDRMRQPKPALDVVRRAFSEVPFPPDEVWPAISVIVCSYNGGRTIRDCFEGLLKLDYPNYEVIVVDDGSTDDTAEIAKLYPFRLIQTENRGLSSARNTGLEAAAGEIVAYIDDDACPDPHWLTYLAKTFMTTAHAGVGGPNLPPPGDGLIADCVAVSPGGPVHVLMSDREAEHIPGCNMAFRKNALEGVGGFDTKFRVAGDDVDICWRLQQCGCTLGFNAAAVVWHHRRNSILAYWKQQWGYGKAEALLEAKWPEKYNAPGHAAWTGRIYAPFCSRVGKRRQVFYGMWGCGLFQSIYEPAPGLLRSFTLMPECYLLIAGLAAISAAGFLWKPLWSAFPVVLILAGVKVAETTGLAARVSFPTRHHSPVTHLKLRAITSILHVLQPLARLSGRLRHGVSLWRRRGVRGWNWPRRQTWTIWSENWRTPEEWLRLMEIRLSATHARVVRGGDFDRWDLEVANGMLGSMRIRSVAPSTDL